MTTPQLHRQLFEQLRQWITPEDRRHLQGCAEIVGAILQSQSACLSHWLPYLSHRNCQARSHLERLSYFVHNRAITAETFYAPVVKHLLQNWVGQAMTLVLDTSMIWDKYCLIEVTLAWGGRSIALAQAVLEHGSATVGFEQYRPVLEATQSVLPANGQVTLLADRGFEHGELMRWLTRVGWNWAIRAVVRPSTDTCQWTTTLGCTTAAAEWTSSLVSSSSGDWRCLLPQPRLLTRLLLKTRGLCSPTKSLPYRPSHFTLSVSVALNRISRITNLPRLICCVLAFGMLKLSGVF